MNTNTRSDIEKFWNRFVSSNPDYCSKAIPQSYYFCDNKKDADECADLVVKDIKKATATSLWWFQQHNEILPKVGDLAIVTDWKGNPKAIIKTTKIEHVAFNQITAEFAEIEGEGDKSLKYWQEVHQAYYEREMETYSDEFDENMIIACEHFRRIYSEL
ncbi:ASCH domain-containing protein [Christiangramia sp. LLG6405-1]|uniref:ASCH domain-containing protein n=1 Tax=Christiangramia sp. LLG6405-1 TaxID=3160832 RepID=UPI00386B73C8